jgi:hypothetical protein
MIYSSGFPPLIGSLTKSKIAAPIATPMAPVRAKVDRHPELAIYMIEKEERADPIYTPELRIELTVDLLLIGK